MPLDTSTYSLALLRVDGRRWNDLRRLSAQIRTQAAADGSSYLEMGNTKVMCVVTGPTDEAATRRAGAGPGAGGGGGGAGGGDGEAEVVVNIVVAGFSSVDRKRRGRGDKRIQELQTTISSALAATLHTHLYPRSRIMVSLHVVSQDGSLLAALLNASTLALVDAGIPMADYLCACSAGSTSPFAPNTTSSSGGGDKSSSGNNEDGDSADPLVDLNSQEEAELPSLTLATRGATDKVVVLVCGGEGGSGGRGVHAARLEGMMATAADGCRGVRAFLDRVVRDKGRRMVREGAVDAGDAYDDEGGMDVD